LAGSWKDFGAGGPDGGGAVESLGVLRLRLAQSARQTSLRMTILFSPFLFHPFFFFFSSILFSSLREKLRRIELGDGC
jgi:hypothetical protein